MPGTNLYRLADVLYQWKSLAHWNYGYGFDLITYGLYEFYHCFIIHKVYNSQLESYIKALLTHTHDSGQQLEQSMIMVPILEGQCLINELSDNSLR